MIDENKISKYRFFDEQTNEFIKEEEMSLSDAMYFVRHNNARMELVE